MKAASKQQINTKSVRYQGSSASISIGDGELLAGDLPTRQIRMAQVWIDLHREELLADWELAKDRY